MNDLAKRRIYNNLNWSCNLCKWRRKESPKQQEHEKENELAAPKKTW